MIELTPEDVLRLRALGVKAEPEPKRRSILTRDDEIIVALNDALAEAHRSEARAWREARRWRTWGWLGLAVGFGGILGSLLAAVARRGWW